MSIIEKYKQYPLVLWALALYLCSLGFQIKYDVPLFLFALAFCYFLTNTHFDINRALLQRHWHMLVFLGLTALVTLTSTDIAYSALAQVQFIPSILIYMAIVAVVKNPQDLRFIYITLVAVTLVMVVSLLVQVMAGEGPDMMIRLKVCASPLFIVPNDVLFLVALAPLALAMAIAEKHWALKLLAVLTLVGVGIAAIYIESRQAAAIFAFCLFAFFFLWRPLWGIAIGIAALVLVLATDALLGGGLVKKLFMFPRAYIWQSAWQMFLDSPLVGKGPGHFKHFYFEFLTKAGYGAELVADRRLMNWAHSLYFEQLAERGLVGMAALLLLLARPLLIFGRRLRRYATAAASAGQKHSHFVTANPYTTGLIVAYAALVLGGLAEASLLRLWTVTLLFLLSGLASVEIFGHKNTAAEAPKKSFDSR